MSAHLQVPGRKLRLLVAGCAGFIGSHLTERLLSAGHFVYGVDNLVTGDESHVAALADHARFRFIRHDVSAPLPFDGALDWVLHFASPASPPKYLKHPIETLRCNAEGTYHLLELARRAGARFFFASTSEIYGDPEVHPQPENYWGNVNPNGPRSVYDEAKRYGEALVLACHETWRLPVRIVRIFNTYGPRMRRDDGRVVVNFIDQALAGRPITVYGDGSQTRSFQYIDDLLDGIERLMRVDYFRPVNIGNPEEYTVLELAHLVRDLTGSRAPIVHRTLPKDDPQQRRPDISLAAALLDWKPSVGVRDGLLRTIEFFRRDERAAARRRPAATFPDPPVRPVPAPAAAASARRPLRG